MIERSLGYQYLIDKYELTVCELLVRLYLSTESQKKVIKKDDFQTITVPKARVTVADTWQSNLLFAIREEGVNLEVLKAFFKKIAVLEITEFLREHPTGARHRRIWMLYENLTGICLDIPDAHSGNYVDLVDRHIQLAVPPQSATRERRYRVNNNLVGSIGFSPYVRITDEMKTLSSKALKEKSDMILQEYPAELIYRAVQYMFVKETKSSFAIERETPTQKRMESFLRVLREIPDETVTEKLLSSLQNRIVDSRYAQQAWRTDQVYVGETMTPGYEKVHCIGVQPTDLDDMMHEYLQMVNNRLEKRDIDAVVLAAIISFAFVFIHPFDDGNGRLHRYLMHYVLSRLGFTPDDFVFPVSAVLLKKTREYDRMLESFSKRLMAVLDYNVDANGEVNVLQASDDFYRYIDYTPIVTRFYAIMDETIQTEWKIELDYLKSYDQIRKGMREIVDLPEKKANQFIVFVRNNNGVLSKTKRDKFSELTDDEIHALEDVIRDGLIK